MKLFALPLAAGLVLALGPGPARAAQDPPLLEDDPGRNLTEKLERNNGVIEPPPTNSTIVVKPPPTGGDMPVLKPPAPPQPPQDPPASVKSGGDSPGS